MHKEDVAHTHNGTLSRKKKGLLPFAATQVGLEVVRLSAVSLAERDKYCMASLRCGI